MLNNFKWIYYLTFIGSWLYSKRQINVLYWKGLPMVVLKALDQLANQQT